jgi:hypothetical protein
MDEERRKKMLKMKEMDIKRILDIQMAERREKLRLRKFEADFEANYMNKDIQNFTEEEKKKYQEMQLRLL